MTPRKEADRLVALQGTISSLKNLIRSFQIALQSSTPGHPPINDSPNPLALLSDASQILKAQTTKLSLLILNKPFAPSEISYILNALSNSCLPALMSALELSPAENYTTLLHQHIKSSLTRIMNELLGLLGTIPQDERGVDKPRGKDTLASTGVLWEECDKMTSLASNGLVALAVERVEEYHSLLKDAIAELEDWDPDEDTESDSDSLNSRKENMASTLPANVSLDSSLEKVSLSPFAALRKQSLATLRIIRLLYPALVKRRIKTFPNINSVIRFDVLPTVLRIQCLDKLVQCTKEFTEEADEIAGALYAGDEAEVVRRLTALRLMAEECVMAVSRSWAGVEDEFTAWAGKWRARLEEVGNE